MENNFEQKREVHSNLKVLCILSYVWIGISFILAIIGVVTAVTMSGRTEELAESMNNINPGSGDAMADSMKYAMPNNLVNIALLVVSLIGVIMMNKLNRKGLIIYSIGELAGYATMFLFGGIATMTASFKSFMGEGSAAAMGYGIIAILVVLDLLFIFLYKNGLDKSNA
jgi:hypothetical protein